MKEFFTVLKLSLAFHSTLSTAAARATRKKFCKISETRTRSFLSMVENTQITIGSPSGPVSNQPSPKVLNGLTKSPADSRDFRGLVFDNGLKVLLVHDHETDKAAGALAVAAGSMCDPIQFPGLAHFLEHMLFLGTEKYPDESGFDAYLNENGGHSNAYTCSDTTVYYFEISPEKLALALDRATEREVNAVNSENDKNIPNDQRRGSSVDKATSNQNHPYSKFGTGNRDSLWTGPLASGLDVRKALIEFHDQFYSSNLMTLTVIGKESLDEQQLIIESLFSGLKNKKLEKPFWPESPYNEEHLQLRTDIVPIKDLRTLSLKFPIPDTTAFYRSAPASAISHLIGHEGEGSLLSLLKRKGWANELSAGAQSAARGFDMFRIQIELTVDGWGNLNEIIEHVFQYLRMLKEEGPQKWIWEEMRDVKALRFRFQDKPTPGRNVVTLTTKLQDYPMEDVLLADHIISDYRPDLINDVLKCLTPSACRVSTFSKENECVANLVEPWYGVKYASQKINHELIERWTNCCKHDELRLPVRNEFIPNCFDLKPREESGIIPKLLVNNSLSRVWFLQDNKFLLPKARIQIELYSPLPLLTPANTVLTSMLVRVIQDQLTEIAYPASIAGLSQSVSSTNYGLEISVSGYDQKLKLLFSKVLDKIVNFSVDPKRFELLKEVYSRQLKNWEDSEPRVHALWYLSNVLAQRDWTRQELLATFDDITPEKLQVYVKDFVSHLRLEWLFCGNLTSLEAQETVSEVQQTLEQRGTKPLFQSQLTRLRSIQLDSGSDLVFERNHLSHSSSCAAVLFQGGLKNSRDNMTIELLCQIAEQPCFQQLRTQEQLGYIVYTSVRKILGILGLMVVVQSNFHPTYLESRIDNFLSLLKAKIDAMSDEEFGVFRTALIVQKSEKVKTLTARADLLWHEIGIEEYNFDRKNIELKELETVSRQEVIKYFEYLIGPPLKERGRLGVRIISQTPDGAGQKTDCFGPCPFDLSTRNIQPISDINEWKSKQGLYSRPKPVIEIVSG